MNFEKYLDALNLTLEIKRVPNDSTTATWVVRFDNAYVLPIENPVPDPYWDFGSGDCLSSAVENYIQKIKGQMLLILIGEDEEEEIVTTIPDNLEFELPTPAPKQQPPTLSVVPEIKE